MGGGGAAGNTYLPQIPRYAPAFPPRTMPSQGRPSTALPEQLPSHLLPSPPHKSGEGEEAGGPLVYYGGTTTVGYCSQPGITPTMATRTVTPQPTKSGRPTFYICQVAARLGGRRIRSRHGNIWQLLAVPRPTSNWLKIRWLRCTKFDIYVVF